MNETNRHEVINQKVDLSHLAEKWPSTIVTREKIGEFTGGLISPGRLANLDSRGEGPDGRLKIGRKNCYLVLKFIEWLEKRAQRV